MRAGDDGALGADREAEVTEGGLGDDAVVVTPEGQHGEAAFLEVFHADASLESLGVLVGRLFPASEPTVTQGLTARTILVRYGRRVLSALWAWSVG